MSGGSPGQTQVHQTGGTRDPGYGWAQNFFNSLTPENLGEFPSQYPGQLDPGMGPTLSSALRLAQGYGTAGAPEIFGGVQGSLGQFMSPTFTNPMARVGGGFPNYFPIDPRQRIYGGGSATELSQAFPSLFGGNDQLDWAKMLNIDPASSMAQDVNAAFAKSPYSGNAFTKPMEQPPGWGVTNMDAAYNPATGQYEGRGSNNQFGFTPGQDPNSPGQTPTLPGVLPTTSGVTTDPAASNWLKDAGANVSFDNNGIPQYSPRMAGAKTAWDMGEGKNRGEIRVNPQTGQKEILMGSGAGGESYSWQPFDPNNYGHVQNSAMFQRYGNNWTAGGKTGGHSTDIAAELEAQLGRKPTQFEIYDAMYGVGSPFSYKSTPPPAPAGGGGGNGGGGIDVTPPTPGQPGQPAQPGAPTGGVPAWMKPRPGETPEQLAERYRQWAARRGDPNASFGGISGSELMGNRDLIQTLGPAALARWNAAHPALAWSGNPAAPPRNPGAGAATPGAGGTGTTTPGTGTTPTKPQPGAPPPPPTIPTKAATPVPASPSYQQAPNVNAAKPVKYGWGTWG